LLNWMQACDSDSE